jgi:hypothetical protein
MKTLLPQAATFSYLVKVLLPGAAAISYFLMGVKLEIIYRAKQICGVESVDTKPSAVNCY